MAGYVNSIDGTTCIARSDEEGGSKPVAPAELKKDGELQVLKLHFFTAPPSLI